MCINRKCDFVCWTTKGIYTERIRRDEEFFKTKSLKLKEIFIKYILPELLTKNLQSASEESPGSPCEEHTDKYCICQQGEFGSMIACDA